MNKPSFKIFVLIIVSALIIGGMLIIRHYQNIETVYESANTKPKILVQLPEKGTSTSSAYKNLKDKDWNKILWGTSTSPVAKIDGKNAIPLTETDKFAQTFFAKFMVLNQNGLSANTNEQNTVVNEMLASQIESKSPSEFSEKDLKIATIGTESEQLRTYGNAFASLFKKYKLLLQQSVVVITEARINDDPDGLSADIKKRAGYYKSFGYEMRQIPAPKSMIYLHLDAVNSLQGIYEGYDKMSLLKTDPVVAVIGMKFQTDSFTKLDETVSSMKKFFTSSGITFSVLDIGAGFWNKI